MVYDPRSRPHDPTKREHLGLLDRVIWRDDDKPACILALTDGKVVVADAPSAAFVRGQRYRFLGRWDDSDRGYRFKAATYTRDQPATRVAVVKYLSDVCSGVGAKIADRLWDAYGPDAVATLREKPREVAAAGVMGEEAALAAADELVRHGHLEKTRIDLHGLFAGRGFPGKLIDRAIGEWGARAPEVVRANPYRLLTAKLPGCGFKRCDSLYLDLGGKADALKRQALAGWNALRDDRSGSTWVPAGNVVAAIQDAVKTADPVKAIKLGVRGGMFGLRRDGAARWVAVADHARAERRVADAIAALRSSPVLWPADVPVTGREGDGLPSAHQAEQLRRATAAAVGLFTGGPGTGKTHTLSFLLRALIAEWGVSAVAVAAPTGKAAVRATESLAARGVPLQATTVHKLLMTVESTKKAGEPVWRFSGNGWQLGEDAKVWRFPRNRNNPLRQRFVIVDESSMIDTTLMADLLDACVPPTLLPAESPRLVLPGGIIYPRCRRCNRVLTDAASWATGYGPTCINLVSPDDRAAVNPEVADRETVVPGRPEEHLPGTHVLFVGDPFQLMPVGHGAPLRDMIAAGLPRGNLVEVRRNAGLIVRGCQAIKDGHAPAFAAKLDIDADDPQNLAFIDCRPADVLDTVEKLLGSMTRFDPRWDCQVLVATNDKSEVSRKAVNARLGKFLNPDGRRVPGLPFAVGDKVICLANSRLPAAEPVGTFGRPDMAEDAGYYRRCEEQVFVANGEVGRVLAVGPAGFVVAVGTKSVWVAKSKPRADDAEDGEGGGVMGDWDHAWAITTHKSQGGEWPVVIALADRAGGGVADRNWWYTAVSRASKACLVVGDRSAFETQRARQSIAKRKTFLAELLAGGDAE